MSADIERPANSENKVGRTPRTAPKLDKLLTASAGLMARQGFCQTSIRDVASETGFSLGGMYYYFENKEDLLFQIQRRTFGALLELQEADLKEGGSAEECLRRLVRNHLEYFTEHFNELKVCTFELESLQGTRYAAIAELRRRYYQYLADVVAELEGLDANETADVERIRHITLFIFGMLNWIFMWFSPERDEPVAHLGEEMIDLILNGLGNAPADRS
ncbi:TetR/AcrR family transcriptional regulator [bacterium]|nr:TetR/AcrR family transcriptional regulator [bacterium]